MFHQSMATKCLPISHFKLKLYECLPNSITAWEKPHPAGYGNFIMPLFKRLSPPSPPSNPPSPEDPNNGNPQTIVGQTPENSHLQPTPTLENPSSSTAADDGEPLRQLLSQPEDRDNMEVSEDDNLNLIRPNLNGVRGKNKLDEKGVMNSIINPKLSFSHIRNPKVFSLFGNFARYLGLKKGVHFPAEVVKAAEDKGEISPDGHNVPLTNFIPYRATYSQKKSSVVRVVRGAEFKPRLAWISDSNKCEVGCERCLTSCNCLGSYQDPKAILKAKAKNKKHKKQEGGDGPPKLSKLTESFMNHVNVAEVYLVSHKTKTLNPALEHVDGVTDPRIKITSQSSSNDSGKSPISAEKSTSGTEFGFEDELPPLSTSRLGRLATSIWIFGLCIPQLFTCDDPPSETSYRILMGDLAAFAVSASDAGRDILTESKEFHNYAEEAMRVIRNLQLRIFLQGDTDVKRPLRLGSGLQLAKKGQRPPFEILVAKINNPEDPLEFKPFEEWGRVDKSNALNNLATSTLTEFEIAKHQIEYLVDDIKETTYDTKNQSDLLYRLSEMYHCIVYISAKSQSNPTEKTVTELKIICETMSKFALSLNSFICASEHLMEKIMEVRDMIHLTYVYLLDNVSLDLSKLMPREALDTIPYIMDFPKDTKKHPSCCGKGHKKKRTKRHGHLPKYKGSDFNRVFYEDVFDARDYIVEGYAFRVRPSHLSKAEQERKNLQRRAKPVFKFRNSRGRGKPKTGSMDSLSSIYAADEVEEVQVPLKPILKDTGISPITTVPVAEVVSSRGVAEDEDEPIIERRGADSVVLTRNELKKNPSM